MIAFRKPSPAISAGTGALAITLAVECALRIFCGLGHPPLVYADSRFGYALAPNQSCVRFGHRVFYNAEGLRSEKLRPLTGAAYRILCVGDSVTNGGAPTNQADTYPYQLERMLRDRGHDVQVLNASAGGWALGNEYGFLVTKGIFGARVVVLEVGSHDLYQKTAPSTVVGTDPNFPDHPPVLAIGELLSRYLLPRAPGPIRKLAPSSSEEKSIWDTNYLTQRDYESCFLTLKAMSLLVTRSGARLVVLLAPDKTESVSGRYRFDHCQDLRALSASAGGQLVELLPVWHASLVEGRNPYRDTVHPNPEGNRMMAQAVAAVQAP